MAELLKILPIDPDTFSSDIYSLSDESFSYAYSKRSLSIMGPIKLMQK